MKVEYKLIANWSKKEKDILLRYPLGINTSCDGAYLASIFNDDFKQQMQERGYDITKMKFEIPINFSINNNRFETLKNGNYIQA